MFTEMLNAPVPELAMRDKVDIGDDFLDGRALGRMSAGTIL